VPAFVFERFFFFFFFFFLYWYIVLCFAPGISFLESRFWVLVFRRFLDILFLDPSSWRYVFVFGVVGRYAADSCWL